MSEESVETLRAMIEDFSADGIEAALAHVHPEIRWHAPPQWLEQSVYTGHAGLRELAESWGQNFEEYRLDVERMVDLDTDRALALVHQRGRIKDSSVQIEHAVAFIAAVQDRKVIRVDVFFNWEAALEAAGISG